MYLVGGDEPLLVDECCAAVRAVAHARGFEERTVLTVESGFDWNSLLASTHSLSLFSSRRLIELRVPSVKMADRGADVLVQIADRAPQDTLLLVSSGRLDKRAQASPWVKAIERTGVVVIVYPLDARDLPGWIARRMRSRGLTPEEGVPALLGYHFEGNLLGAAQEIDKLAVLLGQATVSADDMRDNLSDNARFDVFKLADACVRGDAGAVTRMLASLRAEGTEPILILRVLAREARSLAGVARRLARGEREAVVFEAHNIWPRRRSLVRQAVKQRPPNWWLEILQRASQVDKVLKGQRAGDTWQQLQCLALAMCGSQVSTCRTLGEKT
ncbi:MAG: DNA polymerase III subunit delta [Acidiferrobacterales bacterium]